LRKMARTFSLQEYHLLRDKPIFVDANILIYIFWPTGSQSWEKDYARVFGHLLKQKNLLYLDFMILSEVINRIFRIEHRKVRKYNPSFAKFKDYRDSTEGQTDLEDIYTILKDTVLPWFEIAEGVMQKTDIENMLITDHLDFNDKGILHLCQMNSFTLLTHDGDFRGTGLDILTGNPKILKPHK